MAYLVPRHVMVMDSNQVFVVTGNTRTQQEPITIPLLRVLAGVQIIIGVTCMMASFVSLSEHISTVLVFLDGGSTFLSAWVSTHIYSGS